MAAVMSTKAPPPVGLAPLKIGPAARSASSSAGGSTSPTNPISSAASTPTPTSSTAPSPPSHPTPPAKTTSSRHHHQNQQQYPPQPPSSSTPTTTSRPPIQPAQPRKSLPASPAAAPVNKMSMASVISPMPGPPVAKAPISMTSKEWVIPPRPKPGRKPATDTPPTKRKAQNRAAQRAFRERRAARVGELEEQLEAEREEHEAAQAALQEKVHRLEMDSQALRSRCEVLENMLDKERVERAKEVEVLTRRLHEATQHGHSQAQHHHPARQSLPSISSVSVSEPQGPYAPQPMRYHHRPSAPSRLSHLGRASTSGGMTAKSSPVAPAPPHRPSTTNSFSISQIISPPDDIEQAPTSCGSCDSGGRCACAEEAMASMPVGCGNCTLGSRCQCLEEVLNGTAADNAYPDAGSRSNSVSQPQPTASRTAKRTIRSISPSSAAPEEKRARPSLSFAATETDFTAMFSRQLKRASPPSTTTTASVQPTVAPINSMGTPYSNAPSPYSLTQLENQPADSPAPEDRCGFCEDGTYCVCAEAAKNAAVEMQQPAIESVTLPPITSSALFSVQQSRTPPPSEGDAIGYEILPDGAVKLPRLKGLSSRNKASKPEDTAKPATGGGCGPGGPGTCAQCIADPKSGLFCRSLAASFKGKNGESSGGGCCGGGGPGGGCCKDKNQNTATSTSSSSANIKLSCADAYKTLASHRNFNEAADDIGTWLPMLRAAPARPREPDVGGCGGAMSGGRGSSSRTPIEVEAASIMGVLKGFDVRFGRGE
ncbi:hypothetical protein KVR01_009604 [Diaporthe batatas]|uniref:uncharacterized protein n=1 Tax=Diaporthe batatas TaxID=748121 RepID=UPI001D03CC65|nr:uncharacterized protein KVR01_009604 [Diaporthe batatas]KAG8161340.1 hypothetical protein KVR01_009604 [Diaporthe batatas]